MRQAVIVAVAVAISWAGAFGIAMGVQEWRGGESETVIERQVPSGPSASETRLRLCEAAIGALGNSGTTQPDLRTSGFSTFNPIPSKITALIEENC